MHNKEYHFEPTRKLLSDFMRASERDIVKMFARLPRARKLNFPPYEALSPAVYIPGTRKDRVLLVAHYDTVWPDAEITLAQWGTCIVSATPKVGIGADDRAGIAALWELRNTGHSLLIVPDEEIGCVGSTAVMDHHRNIFKKEQFAIQFDRRGSHDIVTYNCINKKFDRFMVKNMPNYSKAIGSVSDISIICPALGIAGANLSIGFNQEHTEGEFLDVYDWIRTVTLVRNLLSKQCPRYKYQGRKRKKYIKYGVTQDGFEAWNRYRKTMEDGQYHENWDGPSNPTWDGSLPNDEPQPDGYFWCRDCAVMYDGDEVLDDDCGHELCPSCCGPLTMEYYDTNNGVTYG